MISLKNKNIIVTGASGGIGNSIVEKLYQNGVNILATGTRVEKLEELKAKFKNIKILKFDISQHENVEEFINNATEELGGSLDCIINNKTPLCTGLDGYKSLELIIASLSSSKKHKLLKLPLKMVDYAISSK